MITRAGPDADKLCRPLRDLGARVISMPAIVIAPPEDVAPLDAALHQLARYDWIVFTSRHGVIAVFDRLRALGLPPRIPPGPRVAAVGPETAAALQDAGVHIDCMPDSASAHALAVALHDDVDRKWILLPVSDIARPELKQGLEVVGGFVNEVTAYRTVPPDRVDPHALEALRDAKVDVVALASPSALRNLVSLVKDVHILEGTRLVCIGPTTAAEARALGLEPAAVATHHTVTGLVEAIVHLLTLE